MATMFRRLVPILLGAVLASCSTPDLLVVDPDWMPWQITGHVRQLEPGTYGPKRTTVTFRNGAEMNSEIVDMAFIGQLSARDDAPYIIFSGRRCWDCESNPSIYVHSPTGGKLSKKSTRYRYPGRLYSHVNGALIEETRMFFGDCLPGRSAATAVWFVRTRRDTPYWRDIAIILEVLGGDLDEEILEDPAPSVAPTLTMTEKGLCREIPGRQMSSEP